MPIAAQQLARVLPLLERGQLTPAQQDALFGALTAEITSRASQDGLFWLQFVKTRDEADAAQAIKPFPLHLDYVKALWGILEREQQIVIAKSRQMLVSWVVACFMVWWARYKGNQAVFYQCQGWPDSVAMIAMPEGGFEGRCQFLERQLPVWMQVKCKFSEGRIQYPNGSIIQGLAGGANQIRGKTPSLYVSDEAAFQEEQDKVYTAVAPLIQKGAKAIFISTPNGSNFFATLYHGYPIGDPAR